MVQACLQPAQTVTGMRQSPNQEPQTLEEAFFYFLQFPFSQVNVSAASFSTSQSLFTPKFCSNPEEAVSDIPSGSKLLVGGKSITVNDL